MAPSESRPASLEEKDDRSTDSETIAMELPAGGPTMQPTAPHEAADATAIEKPQLQNTADAPPRWDKNFEVSWVGDNDPDSPWSMKTWRKWVHLAITCSSSLCVACNSSMYTTTYAQLYTDLGSSTELSLVGVTLFVFALGLSPMVVGPFSEFWGRRYIYIFAMFFFLIWMIPCAVAMNMPTMLVARFIDGLAGSAFLSTAGGTVGDLFDKKSVQLPMLVYTSTPFLGPVLGPVIGGFINSFASWRWTFYVLIIWAAINLVLITLCMPETYHPVLLRNKARKLRKETGDDRWHAPIEKLDRSVAETVIRSCYRPFMLLVHEPMCLNLCLLSALLLAVLYLFFGAFDLIFTDIYGFNLWQTGLTFLSIGVGMILATLTDPLWRITYTRLVRKQEQETGIEDDSEPEFRLPPAILGAPLGVVGLFWFGFTIYPNIHWIVPLLGSALFGSSIVLTFSGVFTFFTDAYPLYAASAFAANSLMRSTAAAAFPLFGDQMYHKIGYQWATGLLAFILLALAPFPYVFFKYGKRIRQRSSYATAK